MYEHQKDIMQAVGKLIDALAKGESVHILDIGDGIEVLDLTNGDARDRMGVVLTAYLAEMRDIARQLDAEVVCLTERLAVSEKVGDEMSSIIAEEFFPNPNEEPPF